MEREAEERVERRAEGISASAMTTRTGAEKRRRDITMVIKKNTVFNPLNILFGFPSFDAKPILVLMIFFQI